MTAAKPVTIEEFSRMPDPEGSWMELVRGEIVVMPLPKARHGICCAEITMLVGNYLDDVKLGWLTCNNAGVVLERDPDTLRGPDVAFSSFARQPEEPEGYFEIPPY